MKKKVNIMIRRMNMMTKITKRSAFVGAAGVVSGIVGASSQALAHGDHGPVALTVSEMAHFLTSAEHLIGTALMAVGVAVGLYIFRSEGRGRGDNLLRRLGGLRGRGK